MSAVLVSNRVDNLIQDYSIDRRVNTLDDDPSACQYITKEIDLQESASSIKILLDAHINEYNDISYQRKCKLQTNLYSIPRI